LWTPKWTTLFLFGLVFVGHSLSPTLQIADSRLMVPTAFSIAREGDLDLDELSPPWDLDFYDVVRVEDRHLPYYPWGPAIFAVPLVVLGDATSVVDIDARPVTWPVELPTASAIVALATVLIYLMSLEMLADTTGRRRQVIALVAALTFAFGTSAWSTASRGLWQHGPSVLFLSLSLLLAVRSRRNPKLARWLGASLGAAFVMRPTNAIALIVLGAWVAFRHRRQVIGFVATGIAVAIPFVAVNFANYHSWLPPAFLASRLAIGVAPVGLLGTLVSPSRGLFVYSPVLLLAIVGMVVKVRRRQFESLDAAAIAVIVLHWLLIGLWPAWHGGYSYGPRLFTDVLPFFIYLMLPALETLPSSFRGLTIRKRLGFLTVTLLIATSVVTNAQGAIFNETTCWNVEPMNGEPFVERFWDWSDPQMLRGVRALASGQDILAVVLPRRCNQ
jgi:MFS family permease